MARLQDREKVINLRKQGMSYSQIKKIIRVSKSTLSLWLKDYPLSNERVRELRDWSEQRIERCRETKRKKKEKRIKETYQAQKKLLLPLNKRELLIAGLLLYWGEGTKCRMTTISVSNTDPSVIKFFIYWLNRILSVSKRKMKVELQLYNDMDVQKEIDFWSEILKIPSQQFGRPYIKKTSIKRINHKGGFGHGTCNLRVNSVPLAEKVLMGLKVISDQYSKNFKMRP